MAATIRGNGPAAEEKSGHDAVRIPMEAHASSRLLARTFSRISPYLTEVPDVVDEAGGMPA